MKPDRNVRLTALLAVAFAGSVFALSAGAQSPAPAAKSSPTPPRMMGHRLPKRANAYYGVVWGVDSLTVRLAESGEMIRFSYRVLDPRKAAPLNSKDVEPSLVDPAAGVSLVVPAMEKIGKLRQSATPEAGKSYWMAFSNKGRRVKRSDRVDVVIGQFRAAGLVVE